MEEEKKEKGFVIKDRRLFDESGSARKEAEAPAAERSAEVETDEIKPPLETEEASETDATPLPDVNFASFIFSLSTTAMYHFGDFPDPVTKQGARNLPAAKQTIDILSILRTKTEGNLDDDEKQLLDKMLYELRMRYVKEMTPK
ncbi:MAG: DUF1844 domain-containing protein [Deltaproteobacteria bacterium]|nr:DUF1844 domain-containing protein [Deltaproteobacteria bacterium]